MGEGWTSYDSAAASHDRLAVPAIFAQPAKDLVTRMALRGASTVLDVGSGTGVAACLAEASSDTDAVNALPVHDMPIARVPMGAKTQPQFGVRAPSNTVIFFFVIQQG